MDNKTIKNEKALDNKCPSCKAPIHFDPKSGKWVCEYCNSSFSLDEMQKYNNASNINNNENDKQKSNDYNSYVSYKCQNCGAEIIADEETSATFCVYCGNTAILKNKLSGKFAPDFIIPFKKEKDDAINAFKGLKKGRPFIPKDFTSETNIEKIKGIYIPFWLYDLMVTGSVNYDAQRSTSWVSGNRSYTKTDYFKIYRTGSMNFRKIPVDGSTRFADDIMNSIEPFDYNELVKYNHAYLSGFFAEKYDVESDNAIEDARNRALETAKNVMINGSSGYTAKIIFENTLKTDKEKKYYVLLPVWMVNIKFKDKMYVFAMNGQTGEFIGNIPLDKKKMFLWTISIFAITFLIFSIICYLAIVL